MSLQRREIRLPGFSRESKRPKIDQISSCKRVNAARISPPDEIYRDFGTSDAVFGRIGTSWSPALDATRGKTRQIPDGERGLWTSGWRGHVGCWVGCATMPRTLIQCLSAASYRHQGTPARKPSAEHLLRQIEVSHGESVTSRAHPRHLAIAAQIQADAREDSIHISIYIQDHRR